MLEKVKKVVCKVKVRCKFIYNTISYKILSKCTSLKLFKIWYKKIISSYIDMNSSHFENRTRRMEKAIRLKRIVSFRLYVKYTSFTKNILPFLISL